MTNARAASEQRRKDSAPPFPRPSTGVRVFLHPAEYAALRALAEREDRATQAQAARFIREGLVAAGELREETGP